MEKVWARVEEKLDKKEDKKVIILWKKWAIAASLLLFVSIGYHFLKSDKEIITIENPIVIENKDTIQNVSPLKIEKPEEKAVVSTEVESKKNSNAETISQESILKNSIKKDQQVVSVFNDSLIKLNDLIALDEEKNRLVSKQIPSIQISNEERMITGVVMDNSNSPMPGIVVVVRGTSIGTQTDFDGKFSIKAKKGETLEFSYIGMKNLALKVNENKNYAIIMHEESYLLSEVVIAGYKTKKRNQKGDQLANFKQAKGDYSGEPNWNNSNKEESYDYNYYRGNVYMKNKIENDEYYFQTNKTKFISNIIYDTLSNGKIVARNIPGKLNQIAIRGTNSINSKNEPLIILDGRPISQIEMISKILRF